MSKKKRSKIMASIRSKNTKIERLLFLLLDLRKIKYFKHYKITGNPDIAFPRSKLAVFIHGDFWHGWNYNKLKGKLKNEYWKDKIEKNMKRDSKNILSLKRMGWNIIRIWEHQILHDPTKAINRIISQLKKH